MGEKQTKLRSFGVDTAGAPRDVEGFKAREGN